MKEKHLNRWLLLPAFFLPVFLLCLYFIYKRIAPFGETTFLIHDMNAQYVDFFSYMRKVILRDNDTVYSLSRGLGGDFRSFFSYYLISPFNLITILAPESDVPNAISIEMMLLFGLSGLSSFLILHLYAPNQNKSFLLFLSTAYSLSGWMMLNAENFQWIPEAAILPFTVYSIDQAKQGGKIWPAIIWLALAVIMNFYIGYMICIFTFLWWLVPNGKEMHVKSVLIFPAAVLLSAPVWITAARQIPLTIKNIDPQWFIPDWNCSFLDLLKKFLPGQFDSMQYRDNGLPAIYCSLISCVYALIFFIQGKNKAVRNHHLILFLILFDSLFFRPLTMIWQGFSQPHWWPYRFSFLLIFLIILCAAQSNFGIPWPILVIGIAGLCFNMDRTLSVKLANAVNSTDYINSVEQKTELLASITGTDELFRIEDLSPRTDNDAMHFNYPGITHFDSLANRHIFEFLEKLGFPQNRYTLSYGYGNTAFANAFLGVRYRIDQENMDTLNIPASLAYTVPSDSDTNLNISGDPLTVQKNLAAYLGGFENIFSAFTPDEPILNNLTCSDEFCWKDDPDEEAFFEYTIDGLSDVNIYAVLGQKPLPDSLSFTTDNHYYSASTDNWFIPLGKTESGTKKTIRVDVHTPLCDKPDFMVVLEDQEALYNLFSSISTNITLKKITSSHIQISCNTSETVQKLVITLPFEERWSARSGETDLVLEPVFDTFIGITVPSGISMIDLMYH